MTYMLDDLVLPNPKKFVRKIIETGVEHLIYGNLTTKKVQNRKEQFILTYQYLTQAQINSILAKYVLEIVLPFSVTDTNLSIAETDVLMDVSGLEFPPSAEEYRENITITLTEVN